MKVIFRAPLLIIFLFTTFTTINAATITWLGGSGAWDDASQWDTGTVPTYGDDVIIPSGYCRIYNGDSEGATSVEVQSSGRLYIYDGGELEIQGAVDNDGLHNLGRVYIYGNLAINNITRTSTSISAKAIYNEKYIFTYSTSSTYIKYIDDVAIRNESANSYFRVRGLLTIHDVDNIAIYNRDRFFNYGTIDISNSGVSALYLVVTNDDFRNMTGGVINLDSDIYGGISNSSTSANFRNYGDINIKNVSIGVNNHGEIVNYSGALMESKYNGSTSYHNRIDATITNHGLLKSRESATGFYNYGTFINHRSVSVFYASGNGAIRNYSSGKIENYFDIYLNSTSSVDINNYGKITNYNGGIMEINKSLNISSGSSISNYGFFVTHGINSHTISGSFGNKGVIDDNEGMLQPLIPNDRLIVAPVSGPMQVGVPYSNVLDVASLDDVSIGDWKISANGAIAGTYNESTNEFTPNASAVGISTLYVVIEDVISGLSRNFTLEIGSPILPFTTKGKTATTRFGEDDEFADFEAAEVDVFPNPSNGNIQLESKAFENNQTQVQIFNSMGQLVQQEILAARSTSQSLDFSSQLLNGMYIIKMVQNGQELSVKKVQLQR